MTRRFIDKKCQIIVEDINGIGIIREGWNVVKYHYLQWQSSNSLPNKGNNKITELRTILQRESQNS